MKHQIRDHSECGGSNAERWLNCIGSVALCRSVPTPVTSEAAAEGTKAHEYAEQCLANFLEYQLSGQHLEIDVPEEFAEHIDDYVKAIWHKVLGQSITSKVYGLEESFTFSENLKMDGIVDFWCVYLNDKAQRVGVIVDFKYGYHAVPVKNNAQLAFYACALRHYVRSLDKELDLVRTAIFQPRSQMSTVYSEDKITAKQLDKWEAKFNKAAHDIYVAKKTKLKMGKWCKYCPAQAVCPEFIKAAQQKCSLQLVQGSEVKLPEVARLSDEQVGKVLAVRHELQDFISAVENYASSRYLSGKPIPGTKLVPGKARRTWIEDEERIVKELKELNCNPYKNKLKGIGEVEKEVGKGKISTLVELTEPRPALVFADDPRPAINVTQQLIDRLKGIN